LTRPLPSVSYTLPLHDALPMISSPARVATDGSLVPFGSTPGGGSTPIGWVCGPSGSISLPTLVHSTNPSSGTRSAGSGLASSLAVQPHHGHMMLVPAREPIASRPRACFSDCSSQALWRRDGQGRMGIHVLDRRLHCRTGP